MNSSLLDKYRTCSSTEGKAPIVSDTKGIPYKAFEVSPQRALRVAIRSRYDAWRLPSYGYLQDVLHIKAGLIVVLQFSNCQIELEGRNLHELTDRLQEERVLWIEEFDPEIYLPPAADQPVIELMKIIDSAHPEYEPVKPDTSKH